MTQVTAYLRGQAIKHAAAWTFSAYITRVQNFGHIPLQVDMAVESDVERLFAEVRDLVKSERKRLAVLVNNAAQYVFGHVTEVTEEDWDRVLGTNVKGCAA
jgi:NAD(P)-dependent dehydrogenase (short-subunit alcohol dehydrogenase family)